MVDPASPNNNSIGIPYDKSTRGGLVPSGFVTNYALCSKCGCLHTANSPCWPSTTYTYIQAVDLSQISTLITEQRETRRALERLIALVESWQGDNK